jgi:hypothetical protein
VSDPEAILVPGGGLTSDGQPTEWVKTRLDRAAQRFSGQWIITLSAGTTHRPPPLDADGFPIFESVAGAKYLADSGIPKDRLLYEVSSYDTIGNAYFARTIHTDPLEVRDLLVVTSEFHLPRTEAIFDWVFGLHPSGYTLRYEGVPNDGVDEQSLASRVAKEREGRQGVKDLRHNVSSMGQLHSWLFSEHQAYSVERPTPSAGEASGTY